MSNPLNNTPQQTQAIPNLAHFKQMLSMLNSQPNPNAMLQQMVQQNPQLANVLQLAQTRNPQELFYQMCKEKGVDPNTILSQLR